MRNAARLSHITGATARGPDDSRTPPTRVLRRTTRDNPASRRLEELGYAYAQKMSSALVVFSYDCREMYGEYFCLNGLLWRSVCRFPDPSSNADCRAGGRRASDFAGRPTAA
jgi:hypothetical protein